MKIHLKANTKEIAQWIPIVNTCPPVVPSPKHAAIDRWVHPDEFRWLREQGDALGFGSVFAAPSSGQTTAPTSSATPRRPGVARSPTRPPSTVGGICVEPRAATRGRRA